jgi:hypothetical protein
VEHCCTLPFNAPASIARKTSVTGSAPPTMQPCRP